MRQTTTEFACLRRSRREPQGKQPVGEGTNMHVTRLIAVMACGLGLSSCASFMPSLDFFASKPTSAMLSIESDPPGAEARTSLGTTCRTPCTQQVPLTADITVSYALNGYTPQAITVHPSADAGAAALLDPNPAFAELKPAAPPPKPAVAKRPRRPRPPPQPAAAGGEPPPQAGFPPTVQSGFPPPPPTSTFTPAPGPR